MEMVMVIYKLGETHLQTTVTNGYCDFTDGKKPEAYLDELGQDFVCIPMETALDQIHEAETKQYIKPWKKIDKDQWEYWLGVLPPEKWEHIDGVEIFRISERLIGNITTHVAKINNRYFQANRRTSTSYKDLANEIRKGVN